MMSSIESLRDTLKETLISLEDTYQAALDEIEDDDIRYTVCAEIEAAQAALETALYQLGQVN
jgi:hypothetical protein